MVNANADLLGITDDEVKDLQDAIERAKAASKIMDGIQKSGIDCGQQGDLCRQAIERAQVLLAQIIDG